MPTRTLGGRSEAWIRENTIGWFASVLLMLVLLSCSGKKRPFADEAPETAARPGADPAAEVPPRDGSSPSVSLTPASESLSENLPVEDAEDQMASGCDSSSGVCAPPCEGCMIGGECIAADVPNPSSPCRVCDPARDAGDWSNNDGIECDDDAFCTVDDRCEGGTCSGVARVCDDGVACNGVSECDEAGDACSFGEVQCEAGSLCDATSGNCVSTCAGCNIGGVCIADGAEQAGNPCLVCDVARSNTSLSPAIDKPCGSPQTACSAQDTCDVNGVCQPNHAAQGTPCGNSATSTCNGADTCDGRGTCGPNVVANGSSCEDGQFCSVEDQCQGGVCVSNVQRDCGALQTCDEAVNQCRCSGCTIGGECLAAGALSPTNPCQVCDPTRSQTSFSPKGEGALCGSGEQCSATALCRFTGAGLASAGGWDTCVIRDGAVFCVNAGQPIDLGADAVALQVVSGSHHTCALLSNGGVRCWGDALGSDGGQLGTTTVSSNDGIVFFGTVQLGGRAVLLSAGTDYNCAILDTGALRCWGRNTVGQLGYGHTQNIGDGADDFPMRDVSLGGQRVIRVDAGNNHTCAVLQGGALRCWGRGFGGALGYGNVNDLLAPPMTNVDVGAEVREVSTGSAHTCALLSTGLLSCWGFNSAGELGYGHTQSIGDDETPAQAASRTVPSDPSRPLGGPVDAGGSVVQIELNQGLRDGQVTCVRVSGGAVRCWGNGTFRGLGYSHRENVGDDETPREAETINARRAADGSFILLGGDLAIGGAATTLAAGGDGCALRSDGEILCWRAPEQVPTLVVF